MGFRAIWNMLLQSLIVNAVETSSSSSLEMCLGLLGSESGDCREPGRPGVFIVAVYVGWELDPAICYSYGTIRLL